jgi:hypothetical protein
MKIDLRAKPSQLAFLILSIAFATWVGFALVDFVQIQRTRSALTAIDKANQARMKKGESFETADAFIRALRAIDLDYTKEDFKAALVTYTDSIEKGLALARAGQSTAASDAKIQAALRQLIHVARKYE